MGLENRPDQGAQITIPYREPRLVESEADYVFDPNSVPSEEHLPLFRYGCRLLEEHGRSDLPIRFYPSDNGIYTPIVGDGKGIEDRSARERILADEPFHLIVAAGGLGTRMGSLTDDIPKPLLRVNGVPMLSGILRSYDECPDLVQTSVLIRGSNEKHRAEFFQWRRDFPDVSLVDQGEYPTTRALVSTAMRSDRRLALIGSGDKWSNIPPREMPDILQGVKAKLVDFPVTLVGKFSPSARRKITVDAGGRVTGYRESAQDEQETDESMDKGFGVAMIAVDCGRLPIAMSLCDESRSELIKLLMEGEIPVGVYEIGDDHSWVNVNTPELLHHANTQARVDSCLYTPDMVLSGGRSGATVDLVHTGSGDRYVRKARRNGVPINRHGTERDAHTIDRHMFEGGAKIVESKHCTSCSDRRCSVMPYYDGQKLETLLDNAETRRAHDIRMRLLKSMQEGGYFDQRHYGNTSEMWEYWMLNRMDLFEALVQGEANFDYIEGANLAETSRQAILHLTHSSTDVPRGFFPRDLNSGNVIEKPNGDVVVIDQTLMFGSPAIVGAKLLFGWRGMIKGGQVINERELDERTSEVLKLDDEFLSNFARYYHGESSLPEIVRQIGGCQILRHHRAMWHLSHRAELVSDKVRGAIQPFVLRDKRMFESGEIASRTE